jgi:hypothetical protein
LAALDLSGVDVAGLRQFSNRLYRDADAWARRGGFSQRGRLDKRDAGLILKHELAKLKDGAR